MKVIFLGTNGWYSTSTGDTPCIVIDAKDHYVILDAGNGIYKLDKYIKDEKPISMFISHFHIDHVSGLHSLAKFKFKQGIDVFVGKGRAKDFQTLVYPPFTIPHKPTEGVVGQLRTEIRLRELSEMEENIPFRATAIEQSHAYVDHGYRLEIEGKIIAYTGDCGFTDSLNKLAEKADLLITECAWKKVPEDDKWGHLDPIRAATVAKEASVKQLILNHFDASVYTTLEDRKWAEEEAKKIFPKTLAATDGMLFNL